MPNDLQSNISVSKLGLGLGFWNFWSTMMQDRLSRVPKGQRSVWGGLEFFFEPEKRRPGWWKVFVDLPTEGQWQEGLQGGGRSGIESRPGHNAGKFETSNSSQYRVRGLQSGGAAMGLKKKKKKKKCWALLIFPPFLLPPFPLFCLPFPFLLFST